MRKQKNNDADAITQKVRVRLDSNLVCGYPMRCSRFLLKTGVFRFTTWPPGGVMRKQKNCNYSLITGRIFTKFLPGVYLMLTHIPFENGPILANHFATRVHYVKTEKLRLLLYYWPDFHEIFTRRVSNVDTRYIVRFFDLTSFSRSQGSKFKCT